MSMACLGFFRSWSACFPFLHRPRSISLRPTDAARRWVQRLGVVPRIKEGHIEGVGADWILGAEHRPGASRWIRTMSVSSSSDKK